MKNLKYKILLALFVVSFVSSLLLAIAPKAEMGFCDVNGDEGCGAVYQSEYSTTFGVENSYLGVLIFGVLIFLTWKQINRNNPDRRDTINYAVVIGFLIALYFIYLQKYVIFAYCKYCMIVDVSLIIAMGIVAWRWKD